MATVTPEPVERIAIRFTVNGESRQLSVTPDQLLVQVLREQLGLTGTKVRPPAWSRTPR